MPNIWNVRKSSMPAPKGHKPYNTKGEGGCPTEYTDAFIEREAEALIEWLKKDSNFYFKKFALERGYHPQRLSEFAQKNKRFSEALEKAKAWQELRLVEGGLQGGYNSTITKFVLTNCHNWADRTQQTLSGDAVNPLSFVLQAIDGKTKELVQDEE